MKCEHDWRHVGESMDDFHTDKGCFAASHTYQCNKCNLWMEKNFCVDCGKYSEDTPYGSGLPLSVDLRATDSP